jgi:hypothetical protein
VHRSWDRETEEQLLSQGHQTALLHGDPITGHVNKWITRHFKRCHLIMFTYLIILISYLCTVFYTIYCTVPMQLGRCSLWNRICTFSHSPILDVCISCSCWGTVRLLVRYYCTVGNQKHKHFATLTLTSANHVYVRNNM